LIGCGGQVVPPAGWLQRCYDHVHAAGGLCVADEVQVGFGRVGTHWWAFDEQAATPDLVTLGKPIGNGHPLGAVITRAEIAEAFDGGMEWFNTFGGNPVSCAVGMAVLDVIEEEGLRERATRVGARLMEGMRSLASDHPLIGEVRGRGLYLGAELVLDPETREPAGAHASYVADRMKAKGVLISTDGPHHNVLKIKPPIVFDEEDAARLLAALREVLCESALQASAP
ncbi:MAG: aminotransferase class III-fold pyridoxal phosphate-dependent enzyme, partial [Planctomycetota bacterium]|nr:aminotransferase class III-fold pyridoxal phosphate-dependent enzyme [Planctomycetota bacterium]